MESATESLGLHDVRYFRCFEWFHEVSELFPSKIAEIIHTLAINFRLRDEAVMGCLLATVAGLTGGKAFLTVGNEKLEFGSSIATLMVGTLETRIQEAVKDITTLPLTSVEKKISDLLMINPALIKRGDLPTSLRNIECSGILVSGVIQTFLTEIMKQQTAGFSTNDLITAMDGRELKLNVIPEEKASRVNRNNSSVFQIGDHKIDKTNSMITFPETSLTILGGLTPVAAVDAFRLLTKQGEFGEGLLDRLLLITVSPKVPTAREQRQGTKDLPWNLETLYSTIRTFYRKHGKAFYTLSSEAEEQLMKIMSESKTAKDKIHQRIMFDSQLKHQLLRCVLNMHILIYSIFAVGSDDGDIAVPGEISKETLTFASKFVNSSWRQLLIYIYGEMDIIYDKMRAIMTFPGTVVFGKEVLALMENHKLFSASVDQVAEAMKELEARKYGRYLPVEREGELMQCFVKNPVANQMKLKVLIIDADEFQYSLVAQPNMSENHKAEWKRAVDFVISYDNGELEKILTNTISPTQPSPSTSSDARRHTEIYDSDSLENDDKHWSSVNMPLQGNSELNQPLRSTASGIPVSVSTSSSRTRTPSNHEMPADIVSSVSSVHQLNEPDHGQSLQTQAASGQSCAAPCRLHPQNQPFNGDYFQLPASRADLFRLEGMLSQIMGSMQAMREDLALLKYNRSPR